jgi:hypothetical protein
VYSKPEYYLYNHPDKEHHKAQNRYNSYQRVKDKPAALSHNYQIFMTNFEEGLTIKSDGKRDDTADKDNEEGATAYFIINELQDHAFIHRIKGSHDSTEQKGFNHS